MLYFDNLFTTSVRKMAESTIPKLAAGSDGLKRVLCPKVAQYGPYLVEGLTQGEVRYWCRCGLSKTQPWCDGSHKGTGFTSLKWTVPDTQEKYYLCGCKHTRTQPLCDGHHCDIPVEVKERQEKCANKDKHVPGTKLCTNCGAADF